jgi:CheY-like chemotaxis protein
MKERILIIEDDEGISKVLRRALVYEGYQVDSALDGESGLNLNRDNHPDLVVLDWMLPGMDGLEVCRRLREIGSVPILMLTAKEALEDRIHGLDAGADDYMVKPFELDELLARVRALLRRTQVERAPVLTFGDLSLDTSTRQATRKTRVIMLDCQRIRFTRIVHAPSTPGIDPRIDFRPRVGIRFWRREQRFGCLHSLFKTKTGDSRRKPINPHGAQCRVMYYAKSAKRLYPSCL